jgi:hypothetical protein
MGENYGPDDADLDLFGLQVLIALEQEVCETPNPATTSEDTQQLKFHFDAAML